MEATKKTTATKAALLVVAALSMLLSGLFMATASQSDATPTPACPAGFNLTADGKNCFQNAVRTTVNNPNTCAKGELTPDGTKCWTPARALPQEGETLCPEGYSPDGSLQNMCSRFEKASQKPDACPAGAFGVKDGCYVFVAKGPRGDAVCPEGTAAGDVCVVTGAAPKPGAGSCPTSETVFLDGAICYSVVSPVLVPEACPAPYGVYSGKCKTTNPHQITDASTQADRDAHMAWTCPAVTGYTPTAHMDGLKTTSCTFTPKAVFNNCPASADLGLVNGQCRRSVALKAGSATCETGYALVGKKCIKYVSSEEVLASCPIGSVEDAKGHCRRPVNNAKGAYYCKDSNAALNGKHCVFTTGFLIEAKATLYKCDEGTRAVIGDGANTRVICFLDGPAKNTEEKVTCVQGVPSQDGLYCIVPRIDTAPAVAVAAPKPAFTG